jgi:hypothetical protein
MQPVIDYELCEYQQKSRFLSWLVLLIIRRKVGVAHFSPESVSKPLTVPIRF